MDEVPYQDENKNQDKDTIYAYNTVTIQRHAHFKKTGALRGYFMCYVLL